MFMMADFPFRRTISTPLRREERKTVFRNGDPEVDILVIRNRLDADGLLRGRFVDEHERDGVHFVQCQLGLREQNTARRDFKTGCLGFRIRHGTTSLWSERMKLM